jgi:cell shape-determining protein MreD
MKIVVLFILSLCSLLISLNTGKILFLGNISFKPVILLLYFVTLYWNSIYAIFTGFAIGFLYEIYLPVFTGTYPLVFTSIVFGLKTIEKKIFKFKYNSLILLFCIVLFVGVLQVIIEVGKISSVFYILFTQLIPEAIFNTVIGFVILYFIKRYDR